MFELFNKKKMEGKSTSIEANKLIEQNEELQQEGELINPQFMVHSLFPVSKEDEYILRFFHTELEPLKLNQLNLSGISLTNLKEEGLKVTTFLRNSLIKDFTIEKAKLVLMDNNQQVIARHTFDLSSFGKIAGTTTIPVVFIFPSSSVRLSEFETADFSIQFDLTPDHELNLDKSLEEQFNEETIEKLKNLVKSLPLGEENTMNITPFKLQPFEDGSVQVSMFIRNFYTNQNINIEQLPIKILDANRVLYAEASVTLQNFEVKANTTRLLFINLPKEAILNSNVDLSRWIILS